jgi:shikimate dehydrogenase
MGFNTDAYGFEQSLKKKIRSEGMVVESALVLGTGGAAKAVYYALEQMGISYRKVSRSERKGVITYDQLNQEIIAEVQLIVNTTPLGMAPNEDTYPNVPYNYLSEQHLLYDLVYNPEKTIFLQKGEEAGAAFINGLEMLHLQAEKAWEIWTTQP